VGGEPLGDHTPRWTRMRFVRCEACGAKALVAASQCPQCGEALNLRNSLGQPVPLAYCTSCDLYYPRKRGECRWCGAKPPRIRTSSLAWGTLGVVVVLAWGWEAWRLRSVDVGAAAAGSSRPAARKARVTPKTRADSSIVPQTIVLSDSGTEDPGTATLGMEAIDASAAAPSDAAPSEAASPDITASAGTAPPALGGPAAAPLPPAGPVVAPPVRRPADTTTLRERQRVAAPRVPPSISSNSRRPAANVRWVRATVRGWVRVRAAASSSSRTVALIGPDTRVQLGESRAGWVRVRATGISGWAERSRFFRTPKPRANAR